VGILESVVELDEKGRLLIPSEFRNTLPSKRLILRRLKDRLELIPLPDPKSLRGKYKLKGSMVEVEELQERKLLERI